MLKTEEIRIRDPYIVAHKGIYYMYGTPCMGDYENTLYVYTSTDLCNWNDEKVIFTLSPDSWGKAELWAPEVHIYKDRFYLFISILGKHGLRGTQIAVCDSPDGMFEPIINKPATPMDKSCIDGTLYVESGVPYIVYSSDWPNNYVEEKGCYIGKISAVQLTDDLTEQAGEPFDLFTSDSAPCSAIAPAVHDYLGKHVTRYGSDGPFITTLDNGTLFLTWSPIPDMNYIVAAAVSESGSIKGPWQHLDKPVYDNNGGHAMFFYDFDGNRKMCIHYPEREPDERALFLDVTEENGIIRLK